MVQNTPGSEWRTKSDGNEGVIRHISEMEPHYQIQLCIIPRTSLLGVGGGKSLQRIRNPLDREFIFFF